MLLLSYAYRSLLARMRTNLITMLAIALFVAGGSAGISYYLTLEETLVASAPPENILVLSKGAVEELDSKLDLDTAGKLAVIDGLGKVGDAPLVARELVTEVTLDTADLTRYEDPVKIRGIDERSMDVHRATLISGSLPAPSTLDVMLGRRVAGQYANLQIGGEIHLPGGACRITGVFAANGGPFEDEVWTHRSALELHVNTKTSSSVTLVASSTALVPDLVAKINSSKDLEAHAASLAAYREKRARLRNVAWTVLVILVLLSVVATSAIATTMNAAVMVRMPELAALAAIGIRRSILGRIVLLESSMLALAGALVGAPASLLIGSRLGTITVGTNAIEMSPSLMVVVSGLALGLVVGVVGGIAPAVQVRRLDILGALR